MADQDLQRVLGNTSMQQTVMKQLRQDYTDLAMNLNEKFQGDTSAILADLAQNHTKEWGEITAEVFGATPTSTLGGTSSTGPSTTIRTTLQGQPIETRIVAPSPSTSSVVAPSLNPPSLPGPSLSPPTLNNPM